MVRRSPAGIKMGAASLPEAGRRTSSSCQRMRPPQGLSGVWPRSKIPPTENAAKPSPAGVRLTRQLETDEISIHGVTMAIVRPTVFGGLVPRAIQSVATAIPLRSRALHLIGQASLMSLAVFVCASQTGGLAGLMAAEVLSEDLSEWTYRDGEETKAITAAPQRTGYDNEKDCDVLIFQLANGEEASLPAAWFSEGTRDRFAAGAESRSRRSKEAERAARADSDQADRVKAMQRSVQLREEAFAKLPRRRSRIEDMTTTQIRAFTTDRFDCEVYLSAVSNLHTQLLPAESSGDAKLMQKAMQSMTSAELSALDDFVLSTPQGQSLVGDKGKTCGDLLVRCWRAVCDGPQEEYRPIFIEPAMRGVVVALPDGKRFSAAEFFPTVGVRALFEQGAKHKDNYSVLMPMQKNKTPFALLTQSSGKLNGPAFAQFADGGLMMAGMYANNSRTGKFVVFSEDRAIRFAAEYDKGDKEGLVCVFRNGAPLLLQECRNNKPEVTHLVGDDHKILMTFKGLPSSMPTAAVEALAFLARVEDELRDGENKIKSYVARVEKAVRTWRAARNGAMARARFNEIQQLQDVFDSQLMGNMRAWTGN
jgi:hypothetical protein